MEAWRRVEVAACEEMEGPTRSRPRGDPRRDLHRRGGPGARARHRPRRGGLRRRAPARAPGPAGRWIHFGLTSSDVLDTALALQLQAAGEVVVAGARELVAALAARAREHVGHRVRRAHPRRPRRADDVRAQARGLRLRGAPQRRAPRARVRAGERRGDQRRGRHLLGHEPGVRGARAGAPGPRARGGVDAGRPARPPRRAAAGDRAGGRGPRAAAPPRCATCSAPRCARPRSRSAPAAEGLERDAPQAQPDHHRAHHRAGPRAARQRVGRRRERRPLARARHLALGRRARDPARLDDPARLPPAPGAARRQRPGRARRPHAGQPRAHARGAVLPARPARAGRRRGCSATTPTASCRRTPSARGTPRPRCATCSQRATSASTSTRSSTSPTTRATRARSSAASTTIAPAGAAVGG